MSVATQVVWHAAESSAQLGRDGLDAFRQREMGAIDQPHVHLLRDLRLTGSRVAACEGIQRPQKLGFVAEGAVDREYRLRTHIRFPRLHRLHGPLRRRTRPTGTIWRTGQRVRASDRCMALQRPGHLLGPATVAGAVRHVLGCVLLGDRQIAAMDRHRPAPATHPLTTRPDSTCSSVWLHCGSREKRRRQSRHRRRRGGVVARAAAANRGWSRRGPACELLRPDLIGR